jgi:hypothetical protein
LGGKAFNIVFLEPPEESREDADKWPFLSGEILLYLYNAMATGNTGEFFFTDSNN